MVDFTPKFGNALSGLLRTATQGVAGILSKANSEGKSLADIIRETASKGANAAKPKKQSEKKNQFNSAAQAKTEKGEWQTATIGQDSEDQQASQATTMNVAKPAEMKATPENYHEVTPSFNNSVLDFWKNAIYGDADTQAQVKEAQEQKPLQKAEQPKQEEQKVYYGDDPSPAANAVKRALGLTAEISDESKREISAGIAQGIIDAINTTTTKASDLANERINQYKDQAISPIQTSVDSLSSMDFTGLGQNNKDQQLVTDIPQANEPVNFLDDSQRLAFAQDVLNNSNRIVNLPEPQSVPQNEETPTSEPQNTEQANEPVNFLDDSQRLAFAQDVLNNSQQVANLPQGQSAEQSTEQPQEEAQTTEVPKAPKTTINPDGSLTVETENGSVTYDQGTGMPISGSGSIGPSTTDIIDQANAAFAGNEEGEGGENPEAADGSNIDINDYYQYGSLNPLLADIATQSGSEAAKYDTLSDFIFNGSKEEWHDYALDYRVLPHYINSLAEYMTPEELEIVTPYYQDGEDRSGELLENPEAVAALDNAFNQWWDFNKSLDYVDIFENNPNQMSAYQTGESTPDIYGWMANNGHYRPIAYRTGEWGYDLPVKIADSEPFQHGVNYLINYLFENQDSLPEDVTSILGSQGKFIDSLIGKASRPEDLTQEQSEYLKNLDYDLARTLGATAVLQDDIDAEYLRNMPEEILQGILLDSSVWDPNYDESEYEPGEYDVRTPDPNREGLSFEAQNQGGEPYDYNYIDLRSLGELGQVGLGMDRLLNNRGFTQLVPKEETTAQNGEA